MLDREHLPVRGRPSERCVATRGVGYRTRNRAVEVAFLLRQLVPKRNLDYAQAGPRLHDLDAQQSHQALLLEAPTHPLQRTDPAHPLTDPIAHKLKC